MTDVMADEIMIIDNPVFDRSNMICCLITELTDTADSKVKIKKSLFIHIKNKTKADEVAKLA